MVDLSEIETVYYMVTATGVLVAAVYYILSMRATLQTRQAELFMEVFDRYQDMEFVKIFLMVMKREWKSYDEWNSDRWDPIQGPARISINNYFEGIGLLIQRGLLSPKSVADILAGPVAMWWNKQSEYVKEFRVRARFPMYGDKIEYLYDEMMKQRPAGFSPSVDG